MVFKETILKVAEQRKDDWGKEVILRFSNASDAVAIDVMYHLDCDRNFCRIKEKTESSVKENIHLAMDDVFYYLENCDDCQFTMSEIMKQIKG